MKAKPTHSSELGDLFCDYPAQGLPLSAAGSAHPNSFFLILNTLVLCVQQKRSFSFRIFLAEKCHKMPFLFAFPVNSSIKIFLNTLNTLNLEHIQHRQLYCCEKVLKVFTLKNLLYLSQL